MVSSIGEHNRGVMPSGAQWQCGSAVWRRWAKSFQHEGHTPTPGVFGQRVQNRLKTRELRFWRMQKSTQECEKKGDSSETPWNIRGSERLTSDTFRNGKNTPTPAVFVRVANAGLTGYGTWKSVRRTGGRIGKERNGRGWSLANTKENSTK